MKFIWVVLGLICLGLGMLGAVLPLLPTVPFLLLAAFFFARSSDRLHSWLVNHNTFGPSIKNWNQRGAIGRKAKYYATASIVFSFGLSIVLDVPAVVLIIQLIVLTLVLAFILSRPED